MSIKGAVQELNAEIERLTSIRNSLLVPSMANKRPGAITGPSPSPTPKPNKVTPEMANKRPGAVAKPSPTPKK